MRIPSFTAEAFLYAASQNYRAAAVSTGGRFGSVFAQQLCRHLGQSCGRNRSLLLSGLAVHGAAGRARSLRAGPLPLLAMHPRPANLLPAPRFWRTLLYPALCDASMILFGNRPRHRKPVHLR